MPSRARPVAAEPNPMPRSTRTRRSEPPARQVRRSRYHPGSAIEAIQFGRGRVRHLTDRPRSLDLRIDSFEAQVMPCPPDVDATAEHVTSSSSSAVNGHPMSVQRSPNVTSPIAPLISAPGCSKFPTASTRSSRALALDHMNGSGGSDDFVEHPACTPMPVHVCSPRPAGTRSVRRLLRWNRRRPRQCRRRHGRCDFLMRSGSATRLALVSRRPNDRHGLACGSG